MFDFLGIGVSIKDNKVIMCQSGLINKILTTTGYSNMNDNVKTLAKEPPLALDVDGPPFSEDYDYNSVVGMILYLVNTRSDIQYYVHLCCRFVHNQRKSHAESIKIICMYLIVTKDKDLTFNFNTKDLKLNCHVDSDFTGLHKYEDHNDPISAKSRTGYVITLGESPITWYSCLQTETALSSTESEIIALSSSMRELIWVRMSIKEISDGIGIKINKVTDIKSTVHKDNQGAISNATKCSVNNRIHHIHTKYYPFREHLGEAKSIVIQYINSADNIGDIITKGTKAELYVPLCKKLMGW